MTRRRQKLAALALTLCQLSCGAERGFSGVWRQETCEPGAWAYELHLGRYGDGLTGVVVRYRCRESVETFTPENECGCFLLSGGKATDDRLGFALYRPTVPFGPTTGFEFGAEGCQPPPPECSRSFDLDGSIDSDRLEGTSSCKDQPDTALVFESVKGKTRTACVPLADDS